MPSHRVLNKELLRGFTVLSSSLFAVLSWQSANQQQDVIYTKGNFTGYVSIVSGELACSLQYTGKPATMCLLILSTTCRS